MNTIDEALDPLQLAIEPCVILLFILKTFIYKEITRKKKLFEI